MLINIDTCLWIFKTVFYVEQLGTKTKVHIHIKCHKVSSSWKGAIISNVFLLLSGVQDIFWFLDISDNDS